MRFSRIFEKMLVTVKG